MPIISVIVPVYKVEQYLRTCLDSILGQSFKDFELILVDDGSPDKCPIICEEYAKSDNRVKVIHKENGGLSSARNIGLDYVFASSTSQYISFVDSDDYVDEFFLERLFNSIKGCDMSVCFYHIFGEKTLASRYNPEKKIVDNNEFWKITDDGIYSIVAWNKLYKKELFKDLRYPLGKNHEDEFIIHRIVGKCSKISFITDKLYYYRQRSGSITDTETSYDKKLIILEYLLDRVLYYKDENNNAGLFLLNYYKAFYLMTQLYSYCKKSETFKETFHTMKKLYFQKAKTKRESIFYLFPALYVFAVNRFGFDKR